jgi:type I restriction enzyme, S subunit
MILRTNRKYLQYIDYSIFQLWDAKRYLRESTKSDFKLVRLNECINEENKKYKIFEKEDVEFGILGVNNRNGIFDAYKLLGKEIS